MTAPPPYVTGEQIRRVLPMEHAVMALEQAFRAEAGRSDPLRTAVPWSRGELLVMPSEHGEWAGTKLVTVAPGNLARGLGRINGVYVLFEAATLVPRLVLDAAGLTTLRTAAVSALATRYLARTDARTLVVFGTGPQARAHVRAMLGVRQLAEVRIVSRDPDRAGRLAAELAVAHGLPVIAGTPADVAAADIVCTCTDSSSPVFDGRLLSDTAHVNAIGSHRPEVREVDDETVRRAFVVTEHAGAARREAGDLILAVRSGAADESVFQVDLHHIVTEPWSRPHGPTLFKSVGLAVEDLVVAAEIAAKVLASP
ncbi:ornithine cyclodeaminase family protein [Acrocarpospora sp. B8E8]|uniref:ornithine cyclodeaminase family protein n=1 Tax=Acrocarpospora sp. B8E8 TaxID=3153572 RepID=UPI00325D5423